MTALSVNLNKVALLRNARDLDIPSVLEAAEICIDAGVNGITVHPRPDMRHIRPSDVYELSQMLTVEFNIEGNPFAEEGGGYPGFMRLVRDVRPAQCTLVPDSPQQSTSDHGWDLAADAERVAPVIRELNDLGIRVSLFMDPEPDGISLAAESGTDRVELYTEPYASAFAAGDVDDVFERYAQATGHAQACGLGVNAGHDLNLHNLPRFCTIPGILEVSIGHALIADALKIGLHATVLAYIEALSQS